MSKNKKMKISVVTLFDAGIEKFVGKLTRAGTRAKGFGKTVATAFKGAKQAISATLGPLKVFTAVLAGGGGVLTAFSVSSLKAAGSMEMLRTQLRTVMATKKEADKAFAESIEFSEKTPFSPEEIVQTRVALEGVGVEGQAAVASVARTAAALNRNILDVASALKSMETEPLRNLGIMLKKDGEQFLFEYKDKMKQARSVSATGFAEAQIALTRVMNEKFEGGLAAMSQTFEGKLSTLKGAFNLFKADFGGEFLPAVKRVIDDLIEALTGNSLADFGKTINSHIESARIKVLATIKTVQTASKAVKDHLASGGSGFGKILNSIMINAVDVFFDAFVSAIRASLSIWRLVGVSIASALKQELLKLDIPGMKGMRRKAASETASGMSNDDAYSFLTDKGIYSAGFLNELRGNDPSGDAFKGLLISAISDGDLGFALEAELASAINGKGTEAALQHFRDSMLGI
ncbi:MAG: hypothetical protein OES84_05575, partial [Kiritimatiellaceae bacterium]|nr:hypothetical protein [Kiritimatiellaceae bacterium]